MANTPVELHINASGLTGLTASVYPLDSTTADESGMPVGEQAVKSFYRFTVTNALSGLKRVVILDGPGNFVAGGYVFLQDTTDVHYPTTRADLRQVGGNAVQHDGSGRVEATLTSSERNSIANALLDLADAIESGYTLRESQRIQLAALAGKLSGANTNTVAIRDLNDTKDRITADVDARGNRTSVTLDKT